MTNPILRLFFGCLLLGVTSACWGEDPGDFHELTVGNHNPWRVRPQTDKPPSPADQAARKALLELIGRKQTPRFRDRAKIEVPEHASGVPEAYEITLYGKYIDPRTAARLHIRVTGKQAFAELVDDSGIARGELPFEQVDLLTRQLACAFQSRVKVRRNGRSSMLSGSHAPYFTIELFAKDDSSALHLQTKPWQTIFNVIDLHSYDLRSFMHSRFCEGLLYLARSELTVLTADEQRAQIAKELKRIPAEPPPGTDQDPWAAEIYSRKDRAAVEIVLFTHLAVQQVVPDVLDDLRRLKAEEAIARWQIVTAADWPAQLAKRLATEEEDGVWPDWALDFATKSPRPEMTPHLIELVVSGPLDFAVMIAWRLKDVELPAMHLDHIEKAFRDAPPGERKVTLATLLLEQTKDDRYYDYLLTLTRPLAEAKDQELGRRAVDALLTYSGRTGKRREDAYALLKELLKEKPVSPADSYDWNHQELIEHLGRLGTRADVPMLEELAACKSRYAASAAIDAMARLDPELAVRKARERIAAFATLDDHNAYLWNVAYSFDLLFWQNDRAAVPVLKRVREMLPTRDWEDIRGIDETQLLINYLEADTIDARVEAALQFVKASPVDPDWQRDVGLALVAAGADRARCRPLLEAKP